MEHVPTPADFVMPNSDWWRGAAQILHYRCARCTTERHIAMDYIGEILADKYDHRPAGYSLARGEAPTRAQARLWLLADTHNAKKMRGRLKAVK